MSFVDELRYPSTRLSKVLILGSLLLIFILVVAAGTAGAVLYRILVPKSTTTSLTPDSLLGRPTVVQFNVPGVGDREGWFFPGLRAAPVIILCHGYQSQRGDVVTLATPLQENQFNVFVFDFGGHGKSPGSTTLGPRETREVLAAIAAMARRTDIDGNRIGLWGTNLGGYAALAAAEADRRVRAIVVESVYDEPMLFLRTEVEHSGAGSLPLIYPFVRLFFQMEQLPYRGAGALSTRLSSLAKVPKLFIALRESPALADSTIQLFNLSPEPREQWMMPKASYLAMSNEEKRTYENYVVSFFLRNLPPLTKGRQ
jgi:pimeloyl-ACP methyl ester carboxylesterase